MLTMPVQNRAETRGDSFAKATQRFERGPRTEGYSLMDNAVYDDTTDNTKEGSHIILRLDDKGK